MKEVIRVIIVDDEPLGRSRIRNLLEPEEDIDIVAECPNGRLAIKQIRALEPDLVFLDIQMPGIDGFQVLTQLHSEELPYIIFATAYDEYAVRAFEVRALDYLLKPFDRDRFFEGLDHARKVIGSNKQQQFQENVQDGVIDILTKREADRPNELRRLFVRTKGRIDIVLIADIDWIGAAGNYAELHVGLRRHLIRETMSALENRLSGSQFMRIHRSVIVNLTRIAAFEPAFGGGCDLTLSDGTKLTASRSHRRALRAWINNNS